jgi:UDP-2,3-diacylglucosamine hydrolase
MRVQIRSPAFTQQFLSRPIPERRAIADDYRRRSGEATSLKAVDIMDVNQGAIEQMMREQGVRRLIHGHTHRPGRHRFQLDGESAERLVLAEWHQDRGQVLCAGPKGIEVEPVDSNS